MNSSSVQVGRYGWPRLMQLQTAAAYLDMTPARFLAEVGKGAIPPSQPVGSGERWDRHAIDDALDGEQHSEDWRKDCPGLNGSLDAERPPVFSVAALAEHWGCSTGRVYSLIHGGELQAFRIGKLYRIRRDAAEAYQATQRR